MANIELLIENLYRGQVSLLLPENKSSAIVKQQIAGAVDISFDGLEGDEQADLKNHGGADKAIHQYAHGDYHKLAQQFPNIADQLIPGSLGENLSVASIDGSQICIGDIFQLGEATIQVSEPRKPCWKINSRLQQVGVSKYIDQQALTGWYYRVISPGKAQSGDNFKLLERFNPSWSIREFWLAYRNRQLSYSQAKEMASLKGLSTFWQQRMHEKASALAPSTTQVER